MPVNTAVCRGGEDGGLCVCHENRWTLAVVYMHVYVYGLTGAGLFVLFLSELCMNESCMNDFAGRIAPR